MGSKKIDPAKLAPLFEEMMAADEANRYCADCRAKGPRWASTNLGVFICIKCAGVHRSIGTHVTKVKSISLDGWEERQVALMRRVGNTRAARIWECGVPEDYPRPTEHSDGLALEAWIRTKYERRLYFNDAAYKEVFSAATPSPSPSPKPQPQPQQKPKPKPVVVAAAPTVVVSKPAPVAAPAPAPARDLFSFDAPSSSSSSSSSSSAAALFGPAAVTAVSAAPAAAAATTPGGGDLISMGGGGSAAQKRDAADILRLYGTPAAATARTPSPATMTMMMQQQQQQQLYPAQSPSPSQGGNYAVDLREYGLYRHPGAVAAGTPPPLQQQQQQQQYYAYQMQQMQQQQDIASRYRPQAYGRPL